MADDAPADPSPPAGRAAPRPGFGVRAQLVLLVLAVVLPFVAIAAFRARERATRTRAAVEERALAAARLVRSRVADRVHAVRAVAAAATPVVRTGAGARAANDAALLEVRRAVGAAVPIANLWAFDARGRVIGTSLRPLGPTLDTLTATDRRYFREAMRTGRPSVGEPVMGRPIRGWSIAFGEPILDAGGAPVGVVAASVALGSFALTFQDAALPDGVVITLVDAAGVVLARSPDPAAWVGRRLHAPAAQRQAADEGEGVAEVRGKDGVRRLVAHAVLSELGWQVQVSVPSRAALADVTRELQRDAGLGLLALLLAFGLAGFVARRLVRPIGALAADAQLLAAGTLPAERPTLAPGELGTLERAFREMAATIAARTAALHRSELRYRLLFDASPLPMYLVDLATYRFLAVNDAAVAQYGHAREAFAALTLLDIHPAEDRLRFLTVTRSLGKAQGLNDRANAGVWKHVRRDGSAIDVEIFTAVTEYEGRPARLSVAVDVTARRLAERALQDSQEQLRRAQKMEALGRFAGGIAHDFNNLLTGILGYCDLALADLPDGDAAREDFAAIRTAAQRAAALTGQLLAFSRGHVVQPVPLDLNEIVGGMEPMLRRLIGEHVTLATDPQPGLAPVLADAGQLEQVLLNLALNARDAMPDGGTLTIATREVDVEAHDAAHPGLRAGRWVRLAVADTGVGMDAETQARVFEPFFTTKERGKGTGLGLATVYGIVSQAGGVIEVRSAPGAGSTFTIHLPRSEAPAEERRAASAPPPARGGSETILLVEDEEAVRAIARETLARRGYTVLVAEDGPSALARAAAHDGAIDLLLTDVVMPGLHGRELAERLSAARPGLRVLFMSGYTEDEVLRRGVSTEALAFVAKPFTPDGLAARVRAVLDGESAADAGDDARQAAEAPELSSTLVG